jgi:hypothetical protein
MLHFVPVTPAELHRDFKLDACRASTGPEDLDHVMLVAGQWAPRDDLQRPCACQPMSSYLVWLFIVFTALDHSCSWY